MRCDATEDPDVTLAAIDLGCVISHSHEGIDGSDGAGAARGS